MRALIWIVILILIGWAIWYFVGSDNTETTGTSAAPVTQVEANDNIDLSDFDSKG